MQHTALRVPPGHAASSVGATGRGGLLLDRSNAARLGCDCVLAGRRGRMGGGRGKREEASRQGKDDGHPPRGQKLF